MNSEATYFFLIFSNFLSALFEIYTVISRNTHGETFYINFYYTIFQFSEKRITLRIFVSKNTKLYNNDMKL